MNRELRERRHFDETSNCSPKTHKSTLLQEGSRTEPILSHYYFTHFPLQIRDLVHYLTVLCRSLACSRCSEITLEVFSAKVFSFSFPSLPTLWSKITRALLWLSTIALAYAMSNSTPALVRSSSTIDSFSGPRVLGSFRCNCPEMALSSLFVLEWSWIIFSANLLTLLSEEFLRARFPRTTSATPL